MVLEGLVLVVCKRCAASQRACSKDINDSLGFILFVIANTAEVVEGGGTPGLARSKSWKDGSGQDLAKADIGGEADKLGVLCRIKHNDLVCPEGSTRDGGVDDV